MMSNLAYQKKRFFTHARKLYNTIVWYLTSRNNRMVVNCSYEQWGTKVIKFNLGDDINPVIFEYLTGKKIFNYKEFYHAPIENITGIGSIIEWMSNSGSIIWGSGILNPEDFYSSDVRPRKVLAVRGKLTRQLLLQKGIDCPEIYGDPAMFLPLIYKPIVEKKYKYGIIPHYSDLKNIEHNIKDKDSIKLINIQKYKSWKNFVNELCSCECILSSSLHGIILSDAYTVKNVWVKFGNTLYGDDFKFLDYFSSVERSTVRIDCSERIDFDAIQYEISRYAPIGYDLSRLKESLLNCKYI